MLRFQDESIWQYTYFRTADVDRRARDSSGLTSQLEKELMRRSSTHLCFMPTFYLTRSHFVVVAFAFKGCSHRRRPGGAIRTHRSPRVGFITGIGMTGLIVEELTEVLA